MQRFVNNWTATLQAPLLALDVEMQLPPALAAKLLLEPGDFYDLTIAPTGAEQEIVRVTAVAAGVATLSARGLEGSVTPPSWPVGTEVRCCATAGLLQALQSGAGVELGDSDPLPLATVAAPGTAGEASRADHVHPRPTPAELGAATAEQGELAETAVQPGALAEVATSGDYADLFNRPAIPQAAEDVGAIAASQKGAAGGVAELGPDAKVPLAQLPATVITSVFVVNTEAAMLALGAQEGDVAIRPDISTSFILSAEPASVLGNWQELLSPSAGGGAPVGSSAPLPLGAASPGVSSSASRQDHVHPMPSAADVGADAAGAAAAAQAAAVQRENHTGTQAISTIVGLEAALASRAAAVGVPVKTVTGTAYTLLPEDAGCLVEFTSASPVTVTVPAQASVSFAGGEEYHLCQAGIGKVTLAAAGGVALVKPASLNVATRERESVCTLKRRATDSWRVFGDLEASA